jgi:Carboxypeptidase regulatory-like domain/TonB dependent receptor
MSKLPRRTFCEFCFKARIQGKGASLFISMMLTTALTYAQQSCISGTRIDGVVSDPTGAVIPGARVQASSGTTALTDAAGHYMFACEPGTFITITADAAGFAKATAHAHARMGGGAHVNLKLSVASVETDVVVDANSIGVDSADTAGTTVLRTEGVQRLSDDPDDLLRELQAIAAGGGGVPGGAIITVNGFQNGSSLPPKGSIAEIRINPDPFSSQYERAPWIAPDIEITTKPGAKAFHGALFFVESDNPWNATDPFSVTATPASKQRYGFELSGPVISRNSDFFLALEKRDIEEFNVVDAETLDSGYNPEPLEQTLAAPQHLWIGSARGDWQITPNDAATVSFSSNLSNLGNQGVGGLNLASSGFDSLVSEYDLRLLNTQILSSHLLNESRIGYSWLRTEQTPLSTEPSLMVAGYFTGGGAASGNLNDRERNLEADDDFILTKGKHSLKAGLESLAFFIHDYDPDTFNGAFVFGGGSAPALDLNNNPAGESTTTINALEQYRRTLLSLPGGAPTTYQLTTGTPIVPETQWRLALYVQDHVKINQRLTVNAGLRYQLQTSPATFANVAPRAGLAWAPDKKSNWVLHLSGGLFINPVDQAYAIQAKRLNGVRQQETTIYSPNFESPLTPAPDSISVGTIWQLSNTVTQLPSFMAQTGLGHEFPQHWHLQADFDFGQAWGWMRQVNVNAPMVASSIGAPPNPLAALSAPRPMAVNENIFRYEHLAHRRGGLVEFALEQNSYKRLTFSADYLHLDFHSDGGFRLGDLPGAANPQSTYSEKGESARWDALMRNLFFASVNLNLPFKLDLSSFLDFSSGRPYNITTGTDANGDGDFNDRPSYTSTPGPGVYSTPFGLMTTNTVDGNVPRNLGSMPDQIHLDMNLNREFALNPRDKDHSRTLTFNARSTNLLNHTNVTAVNTILSSGAVGQPTSAETARRLELGVRFTF